MTASWLLDACHACMFIVLTAMNTGGRSSRVPPRVPPETVKRFDALLDAGWQPIYQAMMDAKPDLDCNRNNHKKPSMLIALRFFSYHI